MTPNLTIASGRNSAVSTDANLLLSLPGEVPVTPPCDTESRSHSPFVLPDFSKERTPESDQAEANADMDCATDVNVSNEDTTDATMEAAPAKEEEEDLPHAKVAHVVVQFVCDAMDASEQGALTLDVIYKKIRKAWPEHKESPGWQIKIRKLLNGRGFMKERQSQTIQDLQNARSPRGSLYMRNHNVPFAHVLEQLEEIEQLYKASTSALNDGSSAPSFLATFGSMDRASSAEPSMYRSLGGMNKQQKKRKMRRTSSFIDMGQGANAPPPHPRFIQLNQTSDQSPYQTFFVGHLAQHQQQQIHQQLLQQQQLRLQQTQTGDVKPPAAEAPQQTTSAKPEPASDAAAPGGFNANAPLLPHALPFVAPMSTIESMQTENGTPAGPPTVPQSSAAQRPEGVPSSLKQAEFMRMMACNPFLAWSLTCGAYPPSAPQAQDGVQPSFPMMPMDPAFQAQAAALNLPQTVNGQPLPPKPASLDANVAGSLDMMTVRPEMVFAGRSRDVSLRSRSSTQSWQTYEEDRGDGTASLTRAASSVFQEPVDPKATHVPLNIVTQQSRAQMLETKAQAQMQWGRAALQLSPVRDITSISPTYASLRSYGLPSSLPRTRLMTDEILLSTTLHDDVHAVVSSDAILTPIFSPGGFHFDTSAPSIWEENHVDELAKWRDVTKAISGL